MGEERREMGKRERGKRDEGREREKEIGRKEDWERLGRREGRIGKRRMKKCQPMIIKHGIFNSCF